MANHLYTRAELKTAAKHAIGGSADTNHDLDDVINDALVALTDYADWSWRRKALSLNFTADTNYINLPSDFGKMHSLVRNSTWVPAVPVTLERIQIYRASQTLALGFAHMFYAISYTAQASATAEGTWRLEIYPTPSASATAALVGTYLREVPALASDSAIPDIPSQWHPALKALVRAFAKGEQYDAESTDWAKATAMLDRLVAQDGTLETSLGPINGAVNTMDELNPDVVRGSIVPV